jgi:hypothetical protein
MASPMHIYAILSTMDKNNWCAMILPATPASGTCGCSLSYEAFRFVDVLSLVSLHFLVRVADVQVADIIFPNQKGFDFIVGSWQTQTKG